MTRMEMLRMAYLDWPVEIAIETYAKCNARCTFCAYPQLERIGDKMSDALLERIIGELKDHPGAFMISPFKVNEPFLDKRLIPTCRKINAELPNAQLRLFTNGSALTEKHIDEVHTLERVVHLWCSLNDHEPERYRELMGLDFERTVANLDLLHVKKAAGSFRQDVVVSKVRESLEPTGRDKAFADYVGMRWPLFSVHLIKPDTWTGHVDGIAEGIIPDTPCGRWFELSIMANGKVSLCCMDGAGDYAIGDLNEQSLFEVYNARGYRERRLNMLSRKEVAPCSGCSY